MCSSYKIISKKDFCFEFILFDFIEKMLSFLSLFFSVLSVYIYIIKQYKYEENLARRKQIPFVNKK